MPAMVTKNAKKKLEFTPVTVYLDPDDHEWVKKYAEQLSAEEREPISMTKVIRKALAQFRKNVERK